MILELFDKVWWLTDLSKSLTVLLVTVSIALLLWYLRHRDVTLVNLPPGSSGWPIIGETLAFVVDGRKYMSERISRCGPVFRSSLLGGNVIVVSGADNVSTILRGEGSTVEVNHPSSVQALVGPGTLSNTLGEAHGELSRVISKAFSPSNLREITPLVHEVIRDYVSKWRQIGDVKSSMNEVKKMAFSLGVNVLLGLNVNSQEKDTILKLFETFNEAFFVFPINLPGFTYHKGKKARKTLIGIITKHCKELENKPREPRFHILQDLLHRLEPNNESSYSCSGVMANVALELVFASYSTIASSLCTILIYLGDQSQAFDIVRQHLETCELLADDLVITYDDITAATCVHHVVSEALRISPPIAGSFRKTKQPIRIAGYDIPENWNILFSITSTHILSPIFAEQRDTFNPERWNSLQDRDDDQGHEGNNANKPRNLSIVDQLKSGGRFNYIPFGGGQRRCVGKEFAKLCLRLFVMETVRTGRWYLVNGFPEIETCPFVFPKDGLPLTFERR